MTSNIGASEIARNTPLGFAVSDDETGITYDDMKNRIMGELKKVFRPEFLNRIDEVIVFHKLAKDEIKEIVELLLRRIRESMAERELQLELSDPAKDLLVEKGWDPAMGARPLRRAIQRYIEDPLADFVLRSQVPPGSTVLVEPRRRPRTDPEPSARSSCRSSSPRPSPRRSASARPTAPRSQSRSQRSRTLRRAELTRGRSRTEPASRRSASADAALVAAALAAAALIDRAGPRPVGHACCRAVGRCRWCCTCLAAGAAYRGCSQRRAAAVSFDVLLAPGAGLR